MTVPAAREIFAAQPCIVMRVCITALPWKYKCLKTWRGALYELVSIEHNPDQPGKLSEPVELRVADETARAVILRMSSPRYLSCRKK
jgi:hypothetical protein